MMDIVFDVETIPCQDPQMIASLKADAQAEFDEALAAVKAPGNYKDAAKIEAFCKEAKEKLVAQFESDTADRYLRTSLDGAYGQICVIGAAVLGTKVTGEMDLWHADDLSKNNERLLLERFFQRLGGFSKARIVGHNIIGFDVKMLWQRAMIHGVRPPAWFPRFPKPWGDEVFDTMVVWAGAKNYIGLDRLCRVLGVESDNTTTGADVWGLVQSGRILDVVEHCRNDLKRTIEVYRRMTFGCFETSVEDQDVPL